MSLEGFPSCNDLVTVGAGVREGGRKMFAFNMVDNIHNCLVDKNMLDYNKSHDTAVLKNTVILNSSTIAINYI